MQVIVTFKNKDFPNGKSELMIFPNGQYPSMFEIVEELYSRYPMRNELIKKFMDEHDGKYPGFFDDDIVITGIWTDNYSVPTQTIVA